MLKIVVPGLIAFTLWCVISVRWYVCGIHELCNSTETIDDGLVEVKSSPPNAGANEPLKPTAPLAFEWSSATPIIGERFQDFQDSLQTAFDQKPAEVVEITGLYDPQELNNSEFENLGLARAQQVKETLLARGIKRSISVTSQQEDLSSGLGEWITNGVKIRLVAAEIKSTGYYITRQPNRLIIHFPPNSRSPGANPQVRQALEDLAKSALAENKTLLVVGHTDNRGESADNKVLGLIRATQIKDLLMSSGMPEERVLAESEGEDEPLESNITNEGRQKNRRVEIIII